MTLLHVHLCALLTHGVCAHRVCAAGVPRLANVSPSAVFLNESVSAVNVSVVADRFWSPVSDLLCVFDGNGHHVSAAVESTSEEVVCGVAMSSLASLSSGVVSVVNVSVASVSNGWSTNAIGVTVRGM